MEKIPQIVLDEIAPKLGEGEAGKRALAIMRLATHKVLERLKQSVIADVGESTKQAVVQLTQQLGDKLLKMAEGWNDEMQDDLILYPEGTRFVRRRVASQILVIEQKPQVRTLNFLRNLENGDGDNGVEHYRLALPYTVFVVQFKNNNFAALHCAWRNKPLSSISDGLGRPNLPNIDENLCVCMGSDFRSIKWTGQRMAEQVNEVIGTFWQSNFNKDIADYFHACRKAHRQFETLKAWAKYSRDDPLFILNIPWREKYTLKSFIEHLGAVSPNISQQLQAEVLQVVTTVTTRLTKALEGVEIGVVRPGELTKQFTGVLQDILREAYADCWKHCEKRLIEEGKRQRQDLEETVREQLEQMVYFAPYMKKMREKWEQDEYE